MKSRALLLAGVAMLLVGALAAAWFSGTPKAWSRQPLNLTVVFTADANAQLEPCGCFSGQYGGLARIKSYIDMQDMAETLRLDIGNAIGGTADYEQIRYGYVQQAFHMLHYDALNVGARECLLPLANLASLGSRAKVPLVSANVMDAKTGRPVFAGYTIIERQGRRIACVGVVDPAAVPEPGEGLVIVPMESALSQLLPEIRKNADIFVLMAFTDEAGLRKLARSYFEFSLILGGNVPQPSQELIHENRSFILYTTNETKALGILNMTFTATGEAKAGAWDVVLMNDKIPMDVGVTGLTAEYRKEIRKTALDIDREGYTTDSQVPGVVSTARYVGSQSCASCHQEAFRIWEKSKHSHAFASLQRVNSDADPSCISCHTVGLGQPGGYRRSLPGAERTGVGCESCHGPGSEHVSQRTAGGQVAFRYRPLNEANCRSCHYGKFSRPFEWKQWWPEVQHK